MQSSTTQPLTETELRALQADPGLAREAIQAKARAQSALRALEEQQARDAAAQTARAVAEAEARKTEDATRAAAEALEAAQRAERVARLDGLRADLEQVRAAETSATTRIAAALATIAAGRRELDALADREQQLNAQSGYVLFDARHNLVAQEHVVDGALQRAARAYRDDHGLARALGVIATAIRIHPR